MGAQFNFLRWLRSGLLVLALIAVALKVLTPPGFMIAETKGSFPLVICTGHGPIDLSGKTGPFHDKRSTRETPCAFSGHAVADPPASLVISAAAGLIYLAPVIDRRGDLFPGRGLAAPPPPSRGPPRPV